MPSPRSSLACPPDEELVELVEGRLTGSAAARLSRHVAGCSACGAFFAELTTGERGTTRTVAEAAAITDRIARAVLDASDSGDAGRAPAPGAVLGRGASIGRYLILSLLGRGGMGEVYAAYDPELDRRVAVKLLHTARDAEGARRRLTREARALGKLSHPNVVQVHDVGEHEGDVFVAMELVEGQSLDAFCHRSPAPAWPEVLAAYLDAARGLSAAHEKGIVHRDVKPGNLLRGQDGRVRVADFGLAAARAAPAGDAPPLDEAIFSALSDPDGGEPLTATGAVLGTPLYMAPEQCEGAQVSAASDQHGLCTALYQGLYGALPFAIDPGAPRFAQILAGKKAGPPPAPPAGTPVPPWIYRALARGLAPRPEDRYPSMDALAAALRVEPGAGRRRLWRNAAIGAAALLAVTAAGVRSGAFDDPCAHPERQLAGAWDPAVKDRVRAALLGSGRPYAEDTAARVAAVLDGYGASWAGMRREVCEASRRAPRRDPGRGGREILPLREACLDRRRGQLGALTALLAEKPDAEVLDRAVEAAEKLHPIAYCADTEALLSRVPPPDDPALRARAAALQPRVDRLAALGEAGKYQEALALAGPLLAEAQAAGHPALLAQVAFWLGRMREATGDFDGAKTALRDASVAAAEGSDDALAAQAWAWLLLITGERQQRFEEASVLRSLGPTVVARAHDERVQATWLRAEAGLLLRQGKYAEARQVDERAVALLERIAAVAPLDVAGAHSGLARVLMKMGVLPEALALQERALAERQGVLGPDHPDVAETLEQIGIVLFAMGELPRALDAYQRALVLKERALGPDHVRVATTLGNIGSVFARMDDLPRAQAMQERALAITEKALGPDHPTVAALLQNLGATLITRGDSRAARVLYERALSIQERALGPDHPDVGRALVNLGTVIADLGDDAGAALVLERGVTVLEKALGPDHPVLVDSLTLLGRTRVSTGELDAAAARLEQARALAARIPGLSNARRAPPLLGLGELYLARHEPAKAAAVLQQALDLGLADARNDALLDLAKALWQVGKDRGRARSFAEQARAAYEHDDDHASAADAARWLAEHPAPGR